MKYSRILRIGLVMCRQGLPLLAMLNTADGAGWRAGTNLLRHVVA